VGMGKDLYESSALAKRNFLKKQMISWDIALRIIMFFEGTDEDLRQTKSYLRRGQFFPFILSSLHYAKTMIQNLK